MAASAPILLEEATAAPYVLTKKCKISIFQANHFGPSQTFQVSSLIISTFSQFILLTSVF